jgi:hypothetical protein
MAHLVYSSSYASTPTLWRWVVVGLDTGRKLHLPSGASRGGLVTAPPAPQASATFKRIPVN